MQIKMVILLLFLTATERRGVRRVTPDTRRSDKLKRGPARVTFRLTPEAATSPDRTLAQVTRSTTPEAQPTQAETNASGAPATPKPVTRLEEYTVTRRRPASSASSDTMRARDFELRPHTTTQELLNNIPGFVVAQHQGGGKPLSIFCAASMPITARMSRSLSMAYLSTWLVMPMARAMPTSTFSSPRRCSASSCAKDRTSSSMVISTPPVPSISSRKTMLRRIQFKPWEATSTPRAMHQWLRPALVRSRPCWRPSTIIPTAPLSVRIVTLGTICSAS